MAFAAVLVPDHVGLGQGDLRRDPDVGQPVVEEVHVLEDVLGRLAPDDVDAEPGAAPADISSDSWSVSFIVVPFGSLRPVPALPRPAGGRPSGQRAAMRLADLVEVPLGGRSADAVGVPRSSAVDDRRVELAEPLQVGARDGER